VHGVSRCMHAAQRDRDRGHSQLGATVGARGASTMTCARRQAKINACADRDRQRQRVRESVPSRMQRWSHSRDACHALMHRHMQRATHTHSTHDRIPCTLTRVYSQCVAYLRLLVRADCAGPSRVEGRTPKPCADPQHHRGESCSLSVASMASIHR